MHRKSEHIDVLLIKPGESINDPFPPMALACLSAVLKANSIKVKSVLVGNKGASFSYLGSQILESKPRVIGITSFSSLRHYAFDLAAFLKDILPEAKVIYGGSFASYLSEMILARTSFDAVVRGEGEETFVEYVKGILGNTPVDSIEGITLKCGEDILFNPDRKPIDDLDSLPFPDYSDLMKPGCNEIFLYDPVLGHRNYVTAPLFTSRGCPYKCTFCSTSRYWGHRFRARSARKVVDEIEHLVNSYGVSHLRFFDDHFSLEHERVSEICKEILERDLRIKWDCCCRVDSISDELLKLMHESGCEAIYYGLETGSDRMLEVINKKANYDQAKEAINLTRKNGIVILGSFMVGFPGESCKDILATMRLASQCDLPYFIPLSLFPGSKIYEDFVRSGNFQEEFWFHEERNNPPFSLPGIPLYPGVSPTQTRLYLNIFNQWRKIIISFRGAKRKLPWRLGNSNKIKTDN